MRALFGCWPVKRLVLVLACAQILYEIAIPRKLFSCRLGGSSRMACALGAPDRAVGMTALLLHVPICAGQRWFSTVLQARTLRSSSPG